MQTLQDVASKEGFGRVAFVRFTPSLKGFSQAFKYKTLEIILYKLFSSGGHGAGDTDTSPLSSVYLFYPGAPHVWYPVGGSPGILSSNKRTRQSTAVSSLVL
jgi:hypothetical protein